MLNINYSKIKHGNGNNNNQNNNNNQTQKNSLYNKENSKVTVPQETSSNQLIGKLLLNFKLIINFR